MTAGGRFSPLVVSLVRWLVAVLRPKDREVDRKSCLSSKVEKFCSVYQALVALS